MPAEAVTVLNSQHCAVDLPAHAEGEHELRIEAGAVNDLQGTPVTVFRSTFYVDLAAPRVVASSIQQGTCCLPGR